MAPITTINTTALLPNISADGWGGDNGGNWDTAGGTQLKIGPGSSSDYYTYLNFSVTIPANATISSAVINTYMRHGIGTGDVIPSVAYAQDSSNPNYPVGAVPNTWPASAYNVVAVSASTVADTITAYETRDFNVLTNVQTLYTSYGPYDSENMLFYLKGNGVATNYIEIYPRNGGTSQASKLQITYSRPLIIEEKTIYEFV